MFKSLRIKLTLLCTVITGIILAGMAVGALHIAQTQQEKNSLVAFRSDYNSLIYHIQSQTVLDYSWLSQTENGNQLILSIEDSGVPLLFGGTWRPATDREHLVALAKKTALAAGFDTAAPPSGSITPNSIFFGIAGEQGERYRAATAAVPTPLGWVSLVLLKDMRAESAQTALQSRLFLGLVVLGTLLLAIFSWWFVGHALRPVEENQRRQTEFVAAASHELRTPLAVISTSAQALAAGPRHDEAVRFCDIIRRQSHDMARLVDDLLTLARADANNWRMTFEQVEMDTLLLVGAEAFEGAAGAKGVSLLVQFDEETALPRVPGDKQRLSQVIAILLDNAIQYTPAGGKITLDAAQAGGALRVRITDTGPGIAPEHQAHVFERFYRADAARTGKEHYGLGLSIAREIIELHHGKISLHEGEGGKGCRFVLELPIAARRYSKK